MSRVIQVTNVAPQATKEQMSTLFGYLGKIEEIKLYPSDEGIIPMTSRVCYVKFSDPTSVGVAQHLTNTVFIDRALIVVPLTDGVILDEDKAMAIAAPASAVAGLMPNSTPSLPANVVNQVQGIGASQVITTNDPRLTALGLPQYPPLPGNMDPSKIEEIRRTVYVGNLDSTITAEQLLNFLNQVGEVKFVRMAGDETQPTRFAFVEFTEQTSVAAALQYNGVIFGGRPLKVNHSNNAIVKPQAKSNEAAQREIEEAMKRVREAQSLITAAIEPELVDKKRSRSPSRSRSRHRSHSRHRSRSRSRKRSRTPARRSRSPRSRSRSRERKRKRKSRSPSLRKRSRSKSPKSSKSKTKDEKSSKSSRDKKESKEKDVKEMSPKTETDELIKECIEKESSPIISPKKKSRSPSLSRHKSKSPPRKKSRSPSRSRRKASRSPPIRKSRSRSRIKSRSPPPRRKSRSPAYRRKGSRSPSRRKSRSPSRRKSRSPSRRKSRSPIRRKSSGRSSSRRKSISPVRRKSRSPSSRLKSTRSPIRHKSSRSSSRRKSRSPRKRSRSRSRHRSRSRNRSRTPKRRSRTRSRSKSPRRSLSKHKKDKKKERDRSRDRKHKHHDRESDKDSDKASKITRDYDEEEKGYDSDKDLVVEGPALPPPPLPPPAVVDRLGPLPPLPPLPADSNLQTVDMDVDSD